MENKSLGGKKLVAFLCSDFAKGLFTGMIANYLIYILQTDPSKSGLPVLLPTDTFLGFITVLSIITLLSKIVDAVTDPLVASWSDRSKNPKGRRMPFMRFAALPYGLSCVLIFFAPFGEKSVGNALWVAFFIIAYFLFYTLYPIPQRALIPEIIPDVKKRVNAYSLSTVFFMSGSAVAYTGEMLASLIAKGGLEVIWAWRIVFAAFGIIDITLLIISAFSIKEKDYLHHTMPPREPFYRSVKLFVKNRDFMLITFADLFNYIAMAFFQSAMFMYLTYLIGLEPGQSMFVLVPAIATAIIFFPIIMKVAKKYNKTPLLIASAMFTVLSSAIYFGDVLPLPPLAKGIGMGVLIAYPFAAINILPQAMVSDVIQEDSLRTGVNREGIYSAAKPSLKKWRTP